jgi:hypothetical protein
LRSDGHDPNFPSLILVSGRDWIRLIPPIASHAKPNVTYTVGMPTGAVAGLGRLSRAAGARAAQAAIGRGYVGKNRGCAGGDRIPEISLDGGQTIAALA